MMYSFIIPVYNAEDTIARCIDSILNLNLEVDTYEVIMVNDGSTDRSADIGDKYSKTMPNIRLINQCNGGVSSARNKGLLCAEGDWIIFVDADDLVLPGLWSVLGLCGKMDADVIFFSYVQATEYKKKEASKPDEGKLLDLSYEDVILGTLDYKKNPGIHTRFNSPWAKIFRKSIILNHNLKFDEGIKIAEDFIFDLDFYSYSKRFVYVDTLGYYYNTNPKSLTRRFQKDIVENNRRVEEKFMEIKKRFNRYPWFENAYSYSVIKGYLNLIFLQLFNCNNTEPYAARKKIASLLQESKPYSIALSDYKKVKKHFKCYHRVIIVLCLWKQYWIIEFMTRLKSGSRLWHRMERKEDYSG